MHADDVARHQVGRALDALKAAAEAARERLRQQRLAEARRALHQHVAARDQAMVSAWITRSTPMDDAAEFALEGLFELLERMCS